jgi:DNA gyrase inhibitor GyrI
MRSLLVLFCAGVLGACASESPEQSQLDHAQQTWDVQGPASYSFTWRQTCNCTDETSAPIRITVDNDTITDAIYVQTELPVGTEVRADLRTIDGVFATIQDAIDGGAYAVTVEYDTESGLPARVEVDYKHIPDTELLLQISDLHY